MNALGHERTGADRAEASNSDSGTRSITRTEHQDEHFTVLDDIPVWE